MDTYIDIKGNIMEFTLETEEQSIKLYLDKQDVNTLIADLEISLRLLKDEREKLV